ncbi:Protein archease [uncultured archaeon]|nr:Protein archease [uncultured archaeon]
MPQKKFEYLPHTADIMFAAYGSGAGELIENSAAAMLGVMLDVGKIRRSSARVMQVAIDEKADTIENLIWYSLQDMLTKIDERALNAFEFKVKTVSEKTGAFKMRGMLRYKRMPRDCFVTEVKAVTPYAMEVKKTASRYSVEVVLDV